MTEFVLEEGQEFQLIPDGEVLTAEVAHCEVRETPFDDEKNPGEKQKEVSFRFEVTESGDFYGRTVFGRTPTTFNTNDACKLRQWVQELLGMDKFPESFRFNTDTLIGLPCRISVAQRTSKPSQQYPKGRTSNYAFDVLRANSGPGAIYDPF